MMEPFLIGITDGQGDFDAYCLRMSNPGTWGGEPELLMASQVLQRPVHVWQPAGGWLGGLGGGGMRHIITYGEDLPPARPVHVLWSGSHYDLLL